MSIKVMSHVWTNSKQKGSALLLLLAMADIADDQGDCFPSADYLAKKARVEVRSIQRAVAKLVEAGELVVFDKCGTKGRNGQKTNLYRLVLTTVEAALALPVPDRSGDASVTTKSKKPTIRQKVVTPVSPAVVTPVSPDPSLDPSVKDQKKKEVVVAPRDPIFHPVFLEVTNDPAPRPSLPALRLVAPVQPDPAPAPIELPLTLVEQQRAELIALYQELFPTQLTPGVAANIGDALGEFGLEVVRDALREAKESKPKGFVHWKYIDPIMKRRKQQVTAGLDKPFESPHWTAFKRRWHELTQVDLPDPATAYLIRRFKEADEALTHLGATEADVRALVDAKISEERYDYRFDYAGQDIIPIITKRKAPRQSSAAPGWKPIIVSPSADETMTAEQRAEAVRQGRLQRQQVQRAEAERLRALEGESV